MSGNMGVTMRNLLLLALVYLMHCEGAVVIESSISTVNERPIIGVLAQEKLNYTYIAASYVKAIESSGARVVPIMVGQNRAYYEEIMSKINGALFPGGEVYFNKSNGYADAGQNIYEIAINMNDAGDYFPLYGTCLGFELFLVLASGRGERDIRSDCSSHENLPLNFTEDFYTSKMFKDVPQDVQELLANEDVTVNNHEFCVEDKNMEAFNLTQDWRVTSHGIDENGIEFVASVENNRYPFFASQFHPEKSAFEWKSSKHYPHSVKALKVNRYFMDFFIGECRKSFHSFKDAAEENKYLIYNYAPTFTGALGETYQQCYIF